MIFSDSEREYYRKELEAACKAGDVKRTKRLIDQIRLLGDIRDTAPKIQTNLKGIQEYIKQQKALNDELDEHDALNYPDENPFGLPPEVLDIFGMFKMRPSLSKLGEDVFGDLVDRAEMSFRGVLQQGFKDNGWIW